MHRLKPFEATLKPPEGSAEAPEEPDAAADVDPEADAEQFVQHASSNMCEPMLRVAALGIHGRMLGGLVQQVSSLFLLELLLYCSFRAFTVYACKGTSRGVFVVESIAVFTVACRGCHVASSQL